MAPARVRRRVTRERALAGGARRLRAFPETRVSVVVALSSPDIAVRERATAAVLEAYRDPVIAVLQRRWGLEPEDAEDLAHDFFAQALARDWLARYDPARGRFRTFLRSCLLAFAATSHASSTRRKRGGDVRHVSLGQVPILAGDAELEQAFDREWTRSVLGMALRCLREDCAAAGRETTWRVFVAYDVDGADGERPTYAALARELEIPVTQVTNFLNWARRRFREHVLHALRALTANDDEYREELRSLLGREER